MQRAPWTWASTGTMASEGTQTGSEVFCDWTLSPRGPLTGPARFLGRPRNDREAVAKDSRPLHLTPLGRDLHFVIRRAFQGRRVTDAAGHAGSERGPRRVFLLRR